MGPIAASRRVPAPIGAVFGFLAVLENHWRLTDRWITVLSLDGGGDHGSPAQGGVVRMRGPLGISRTARTRVVGAEPPLGMHGTADVSARTRAAVTWSFADREGATDVLLSAEVTQASVVDRALLAFGGAAWMRRRFRSVLANLEAVVAAERAERARAYAPRQ
jgi:hypothetical protein